MPSEGTCQWHDAVAEQPAADIAGCLAGGCGDVIAGDPFRQRHRHAEVAAALEAIALVPVFVDQVSVPQIGDAGAADPAQAGQGAEHALEPGSVSNPLPPRSRGAP